MTPPDLATLVIATVAYRPFGGPQPDMDGTLKPANYSVVHVVACGEARITCRTDHTDLKIRARRAEMYQQVQRVGSIRFHLRVGGEGKVYFTFTTVLGKQDAGTVADLLGVNVVGEGRTSRGSAERADDGGPRRYPNDGCA